LQEKQYTFDKAFHAHATNSDVYKGTIAPLITHALHGINCTVFAYGATGSGKTYTMVGDSSDPGLMVRSIEALFKESERYRNDEAVSITASYLEVYNEVSYILFSPELRIPNCVPRVGKLVAYSLSHCVLTK
jgi:kinesin family protein 18/19